MSRPATRNKKKRHRPEDEVDQKTEILRKIHSTGSIAQDDVEYLYNIRKTICQGCRVNTKDNPNCLCGLVPPPNGSRKTGLWQKSSDMISLLGPDPSIDLRDSDDYPAGLTNLGATCYANSILQYLYMNRPFREGIFSVEPEVLKQHPVLDQLARLFVQLHSSKRAFIDSSPFIETLELDNGVQQDSHEFLTLLLSLLERCLSISKVSKVRTIVPDLFRGSMSHVTRCSKCGKDSQASSNSEDFYELELNVKGLKNLDESLNDYLTVEALDGDNQYFCESCETRVDATRSIMLRSLPRVLNFQLKRYVFHPQTSTKKKITAAFSFPQELDMGLRLSEPSDSPLIYDLSAVLVHKGTAANSGHYLAHIKDESSGQWWEFDDEHVSKLGHHPFGEVSSSASSKLENGPLVDKNAAEKVNPLSVHNHVNSDQLQLSDVNSVVDTYWSSDAYMLMYILRKGSRSGQVYHMHSADAKEALGDVIPLNIGVSPPGFLSEEVKKLNALCLDACERYNQRKDEKSRWIAERRKEVRLVLYEAPVLSLEEPYFWISTDWLRQWADNITPPALDNSTILCVHSKVPMSKIGFMKRLSANAWAFLHSKYNGGPCLSNKDYCVKCLVDGARATVSADSYRDRRASMKELAEAALGGKCCDGSYYVSRTWLQQWLRRKNIDYPCEADAGPTASISCPHGHLLPEQAAGAKRVLIPESLWLFLYENANLVKPEDQLGSFPFPSEVEACEKCSTELSEVACFEHTMRENKLKQRQNHEKLALGKSLPLHTNCNYYLLPSLWVSKWRTYVNASGKNISASVEPELLDGIIESLRCDKHSRLLERPLGLICKRNMISQKSSNTDGLTLVTENDWKAFCEEWGGKQERGLLAEVEFCNPLENNLVGASQQLPVTEDQMDGTDDFESRQPVIKTVPEICEECIGERESCELMEKLNYFNEDICVCFVRGKEAPKSILEASKNSFELDRRTSKRSRKTAFGNSINLKVSGSTSIYQLKMMIWESFGVVKENQILHKGSNAIDGESATLADLNVFPGDVLWVTDSEIHEHRDIADELSGHKSEAQQAEEGFRGTLLASTTASQLV